jgi:hypothetical protein
MRTGFPQKWTSRNNVDAIVDSQMRLTPINRFHYSFSPLVSGKAAQRPTKNEATKKARRCEPFSQHPKMP